MKKIYSGLICAAILLGAGVTTIPEAVHPTTVSAATNDIGNYGLTNIGTAVVTMKDTGGQIYDASGNPTGRTLPMGSKWKTSTENTLSSGSYYKVATNEYVKASDVDLSISDGASDGTHENTNYNGVAVTNINGATIYSDSGSPIGKTLPYGSDWKIGYQINLAGGTFYEVGSGEFVSASDVRPYQNTINYKVSRVITTRSGAPARLYDSNGQLIGSRALAPNTSWYTDRFSDIGMMGFYRVATNEYVSDADIY